MLVALRDDYALERTAAWDALGMRGTCCDGFRCISRRTSTQILPVSFAEIAAETMLPVSHLLWSSVWLGIAADAVARARAYLRQQARSGSGALSPSGYRLARERRPAAAHAIAAVAGLEGLRGGARGGVMFAAASASPRT